MKNQENKFSKEIFFAYLDEAEMHLLSRTSLSIETDLIDRIIDESSKHSMLKDQYHNLYERINNAGEDRDGAEILINFFNVARSTFSQGTTHIDDALWEEVVF